MSKKLNDDSSSVNIIESDNKKRQKVPGSGRKKGSANKTTVQMKELFTRIIEKNVVSLEGLINGKKRTTLDEGELVRITVDLTKALIPYVMPRQNEQKISFDEETTKAIGESIAKLNKLF